MPGLRLLHMRPTKGPMKYVESVGAQGGPVGHLGTSKREAFEQHMHEGKMSYKGSRVGTAVSRPA
jgi:hypothetical protein